MYAICYECIMSNDVFFLCNLTRLFELPLKPQYMNILKLSQTQSLLLLVRFCDIPVKQTIPVLKFCFNVPTLNVKTDFIERSTVLKKQCLHNCLMIVTMVTYYTDHEH